MTSQRPRSFYLFDTAAAALSYRRANGTGGWIFEYAGSGEAMLFPHQMTASAVFHSVFVTHHAGRLIGTADA
jgi:hypothetical protein